VRNARKRGSFLERGGSRFGPETVVWNALLFLEKRGVSGRAGVLARLKERPVWGAQPRFSGSDPVAFRKTRTRKTLSKQNSTNGITGSTGYELNLGISCKSRYPVYFSSVCFLLEGFSQGDKRLSPDAVRIVSF